MASKRAMAVALTLVLVGWGVAASANTITFSGPVMSDYDAPYTVFDAVIEYTYSAGVLTLVLHNDTAAPNAYTLSELCFNVSSDVTGLSILNDGALTNTSLSTSTHGGPFGVFDYCFDLGQGNNGITAGNSETVTFNVTGLSVDTDDFFNGLSLGVAGGGNQIATIHFTRGPEGDSTWVTPGEDIVPEPSTIVLLGLAVSGMVMRRRFAK